MKQSKLLHSLKIVAFILLSSLSFYGYAQTNPSSQLISLLNNFHSMSAQFNQTIIDPQGNAIQQTSGTMALQRPGKFRWETQHPNAQLALADGKNIWLYDSQLQQATRQTQVANNNSPGALLSGDVTKLSKEFNINALSPIANSDQGFNLSPKNKDALFQSVALYFNHGILVSMRLKDNLDQTTVIKFTGVKNNSVLGPSVFHFVPPKGVDVVTG